jgi:hypothetical protein
MQADDLTREQAAALKNKLRPTLAYLGKLKRRPSGGLFHAPKCFSTIVRSPHDGQSA